MTAARVLVVATAFFAGATLSVYCALKLAERMLP